MINKICGNCAYYTDGQDFLLIASGLELNTEPSIGCLGYASAPACDDYKPLSTKYAQKIRSMTDEELAELFEELCYDSMAHRAKYWLHWLQQPAEEEPK